MTPDAFIEWARQMRELGAVEVSATEQGYTARFASAQPVSQARPMLPPKVHEPDAELVKTPEGRRAIREGIMRRLGNG